MRRYMLVCYVLVHNLFAHLVTKLSAKRSSTVCLSMFGGTNSSPFLAQRVARLGDRIWQTQRFGQICARTAMATASIKHSSSRSMVTTPPPHPPAPPLHLDTTPGEKEGLVLRIIIQYFTLDESKTLKPNYY